jgi:hypothetical protein
VAPVCGVSPRHEERRGNWRSHRDRLTPERASRAPRHVRLVIVLSERPTNSPETTVSTGSTSAPVDPPHPCAPLSCMDTGSERLAAAFHGCRSGAWSDRPPTGARWSSRPDARRAARRAPRIVYLSGSDGRPVRGSACGTALVIAAASVRPKAIVRATCRSVLRVAEARAGRGVDWP